MVRSIEKELLQSLRDIIHAHTDSTQEPKQRMHAILTDLYQFLEENSEICTALLSPSSNDTMDPWDDRLTVSEQETDQKLSCSLLSSFLIQPIFKQT